MENLKTHTEKTACVNTTTVEFFTLHYPFTDFPSLLWQNI